MQWPAALAAAAALPVLAGTLGVMVFVSSELLGRTPPLAEPSPRNLAEAAGRGSVPDIWRLLDAGHDPHRVYDVGPHIISSSIPKVTPGEAAIWSRRVEVVQFLDRRQALGTPAERRRLACLARELNTEDIAEYLTAGRTVDCSRSVVEDIVARAR